MKSKERKLARQFRYLGLSVGTIAKKISCAKSSVSKWVRDIPLTGQQIERLKSNQDKGRAKAARHPNSPKQKWERIRNKAIQQAAREIPRSTSKLNLKILGTALYWAEGYNASRNVVLFANSDPAMIKIMMKFLKEICHVPEDKIKGRVNIHPHLNIEKAEKFWSSTAGIPKRNFNKPLLAISKASKQKRNTLPLGTFNIIISDVMLASRIKGWINGLGSWAVSSFG